MQEEVGGVTPLDLFSATSDHCVSRRSHGYGNGSDSNNRVREGSLESQALNGAVFREVAMHQIYLTITVSGLTLLVGMYVLGVALV